MMSKNDEIISIPFSPPSSGSPASSSSVAPSSPEASEETNKPLVKGSNRRRYLREKLGKCKDKTLESELCRTINKYVTKCLSDDKCRRITAITIMILAVIGVYHILITLL